MKKSFVVILFMIWGTFAQAQTQPGNFMVGGNLSTYSQTFNSNNDLKIKGTTFAPAFGYFFAENMAAGLTLSVSSSESGTNLSKEETTSFSAGPFFRYYLFTSNENFAFFGHAGFQAGTGKRDFTPGGETNTSSFQFSLSPGFAYFFNQHWAAEFSVTGLAYRSEDPDKDTDDDTVTRFDFGISSLSPALGFRYHF